VIGCRVDRLRGDRTVSVTFERRATRRGACAVEDFVLLHDRITSIIAFD
jgi:hypothetical protein